MVLAGMSLFWSQWGAEFYTPTWIGRLVRQWRCSVVRAALAVEPDGFLDNGQRELDKLCRVIDALIDLGVYAVVDWHSHRPHTDRACDFFTRIAQRYGDAPNLIYETWNEPLKTDDWVLAIRPHHHAVIDAIRASAANALVICGTGSQCRDVDVAALAPVERANVCYALHFYAGSHRQGLRDKVARARLAGACVFASEYGLGEASGGGILDLDEARRWWRFLAEARISNINWSLTDKQETCAALIRNPWPVALARPHRLSPSGKAVARHLRVAASRWEG